MSKPKFSSLYLFAVIYAADYASVKLGQLCDVQLLGWNKSQEKAIKEAKENAQFDGREDEQLLVLEVDLLPCAKLAFKEVDVIPQDGWQMEEIWN
jgi:hypothetical protein